MKIEKIVIEVREATEDDLDQVVDLWKSLAEHHAELSEDFALAWDSKRRWSSYLRSKFAELSTKLIVAEEDGDIVGFMLCMLSPNVPIYKERKLGVMSDAYVLEERRRRGVAKKMFDVALKWFRKNKVKTVDLNVAAINLEAQSVWETLGFSPFMIRERLYLDEIEGDTPPRITTRLVRRKETRTSGIKRRIRSPRKPS